LSIDYEIILSLSLSLSDWMKRITVIFLMFLYLIPAIGVTVSAHYCGGKVTSVSLNPFNTKHDCPCGSRKMEKDCCKNEISITKLDDKQQKKQQVFCNVVNISDFHCAISFSQTFNGHSLLLSSGFDHSTHPPDDLKHPIYIRYCIFRI